MRFDERSYLDAYVGVLQALDTTAIEGLAATIFAAWRRRRTVFCCGNGGSAASAGHFVADLTKLTAPPRGPRLKAVALTDSMAALSAIANDLAYEDVFAEQLRAFVEPGDVVVGFSTSGASPNVLRAIEQGNDAGAATIGITGIQGTALGDLARQTLFVEATSVQQIEDATMVVAHLLCLRVRELIAEAVATEEAPGARAALSAAAGGPR